MKYEKLNLIHIQTNDYLVILTHKIDTSIVLTIFLKKCENGRGGLNIGTNAMNRTNSNIIQNSTRQLTVEFGSWTKWVELKLKIKFVN